jgi:anti-sigma regulatory factor (Ser/Thr protein kinase)
MPDEDAFPPRPPAGVTGPPLLSEKFDQRVITRLRHSVGALASTTGLAGQRLDDFVLAVNEMMTNAVRYAGGWGRLTLWCADSMLECEVADEGPGIPAATLRTSHERPSTFAVSGRGLWLAQRLCDRFTIDTGPHGTRVRLAIALP